MTLLNAAGDYCGEYKIVVVDQAGKRHVDFASSPYGEAESKALKLKGDGVARDVEVSCWSQEMQCYGLLDVSNPFRQALCRVLGITEQVAN